MLFFIRNFIQLTNKQEKFSFLATIVQQRNIGWQRNYLGPGLFRG